jgi:hypothetical protein
MRGKVMNFGADSPAQRLLVNSEFDRTLEKKVHIRRNQWPEKRDPANRFDIFFYNC